MNYREEPPETAAMKIFATADSILATGLPRLLILLVIVLGSGLPAVPADELERWAYLREPLDPYYVHREFPKLVTPQWIGEAGVDCVVTLGIDDMRDPAVYERFLRPILDRLKRIDGRAPVSIMTCNVPADHPQLRKWREEGLSIEVHTVDHPCPCLQGGDWAKAKSTYDRGVDLMHAIPGNRPVAFRMPCCDSLNTPSPRFWHHAFSARTPQANFLQIDSSVFNIITGKDGALPREIVELPDGGDRFRRYIPFPSFVNTIEDYPYPYVIDGTCWEFPCVVPSDWSAQHVQRANNPDTIRDWKFALDAAVIKRGTFNLVFHPHNWIRAEQVVELIDYAVEHYGGRVKFLTFGECAERLNRDLLDGNPIRNSDGTASSTRLVDVNGDGYLDVVYRDRSDRFRHKIWDDERAVWRRPDRPIPSDLTLLLEELLVPADRKQVQTWYRDIDGDGRSERIQIDRGGADGPTSRVALRREDGAWSDLPWGLPAMANRLHPLGDRAELRFVDLDGDRRLDVLYSGPESYGAYLFESLEKGWSRRITEGTRGTAGTGPVIPPLVRADGTNNGGWFHSRRLWLQNEDTNRLPDHVDRVSYDELLADFNDRKLKRAMPPALVGAARIDITPDGPIRLSGYGNRKLAATEVSQRLAAQALAIGGRATGDNGGGDGADGVGAGDRGAEADGPAILIAVDNCGMTASVRDAVVRALHEQGVRPERVVITVTHTHAAPCLDGWAPYLFGEDLSTEERAAIDAYTTTLTEKLIAVSRAALAARQPARLSWGQGAVGFAANRRVLKDGKWAGFGVEAGGPVDHALPVLAAHDLQGRLLAVVANYACHCTTLTGEFNQISGDWAGYARESIERSFPGAVGIITIGCGADANPAPRGAVEMAVRHGDAIAAEVRRLLATDLTPISPQLDCRMRTLALELESIPDRDQWEERARQPGAIGYHARQHLRKLDQADEISSTVPYPIATWVFGARLSDGDPRPHRIGDLAMVFLSGEVVVDYATRLRGELDASRLWITAYANTVPCYIPSRRLLNEGGYEVDTSMLYYGIAGRFRDEVEDSIVDTVQKLLPAWFYPAPKQADIPPPKSPREALESMRLRPGLRIELVAAEPLVEDPVAFDWGLDGSLWVVEMRDYPNGLNWNGPGDAKGVPGGRVKRLVDRDADGVYDQAELFLDEIPFPTGIKVWRKGVIVSTAPEVFFAEDTDGDGRADRRTVLLRGFQEGNQQHRVNGLRWGIDNWLYLANGDSGGEIHSTRSMQTVGISGRDLRFRPDTGELDAQTGQTQFGRNRDDWGNWFGGNNANPIWHYVLEDHYLRRNPHIAPPELRVHISEQPGAAPVFPTSRTLARFNDFNMSNRFTSACSPEVYRDMALGMPLPEGPFSAHVFICEPVHNLVHHEVMTGEGVSFRSRRPADEQQSEFLSSSDNWFRPVMARTGPDGGLWIADMYRAVIEHPEWIPLAWQRKLDLRAGSDRGRIYRVVAADAPRRALPNLEPLDAQRALRLLESSNGWLRDMGQQWIVWNDDASMVPSLESLVRRSALPQSRMQALCTLEGLGRLSEDVLKSACGDSHPGVRRQAVRLLESLAATAGAEALKTLPAELIGLLHDPDPSVRLQVASSIGQFRDARGGELLAEILVEGGGDPYHRAAALSSLHEANIESALRGVLTSGLAARDAAVLDAILSTAAVIVPQDRLSTLLASLVRPVDGGFQSWQFSALAAILDASDRRQRQITRLVDSEVREAFARLTANAGQVAMNDTAPIADRLAAIRLLGRDPDRRDAERPVIQELLSPRVAVELQSAAVAAAARTGDATVPATLLAGWEHQSPGLRAVILDLIIGRVDWTQKLLEMVEAGTLPASQLDARRRQQLLAHVNDSIRQRAAQLFATAGGGSKAELVRQYLAEMNGDGDEGAGKLVFAKRCAPCHRLNGEGHAVGPDLTALAGKPLDTLVTSVLDPNRAIEDRYLDYVVVTDDGRSLTGMLAAETSTSVTLLGQDGKSTTVLRAEIDALKSTGKSLMPEGLEKDISPRELRDAIAYLRRHASPPKKFAGNEPATVFPEDDGALKLLATNARIYGPSLVFEDQYRNLGYWQSTDDRAVWTIAVRKAGRYRCVIDYAAHADSAGDRYVVEVGDQTIGGSVVSTGEWDQYRTREVGVLQLEAGTHELVMRGLGPIKSAMIDLRGIRLYPMR